MIKVEIKSLDTINESVNQFIDAIGDRKIIAFHGEMGVGKTTFIKALCKKLGVESTITSPTFSIVNEYSTLNNGLIYHFDMYRIEEESEALDFGIEDYFYSGEYVFIEWPERVQTILPDNTVMVTIIEKSNKKREIILK